MSETMKERRARMKTQGICVDCQQRPAIPPSVLCDECRQARTSRYVPKKPMVRAFYRGALL